VVFWHPSSNRDETVFADPFRFDIHRSPKPSHRLRHRRRALLLGRNLAQKEIRAVLESTPPDTTSSLPDPRCGPKPSRFTISATELNRYRCGLPRATAKVDRTADPQRNGALLAARPTHGSTLEHVL
jgi:hypothetical protein